MDATCIPPILEKKYSLSLIMKVKNKPGMTKTELMTSEDKAGNDRTRFLRIKDLIENGIFEVGQDSRQHNTMHIYLTNKGQTVAYHLDEIIKCLDE